MSLEEKRERWKLAARERRKKHPERNREVCLKWRNTHLEQARQSKRESFKKHPESLRRGRRAWKKRNREKVNVHAAVAHALKRGWIKKAVICENCGATGRLEAHHWDYSQRLSVTWLCRICHANIK